MRERIYITIADYCLIEAIKKFNNSGCDDIALGKVDNNWLVSYYKEPVECYQDAISNSNQDDGLEQNKAKKIKGCYFGKDELGKDFFAKCDCVDCQKRTIALLDLRKEYLNKINKESYQNSKLIKAKEIIEKLISQNRKLWVYSDIREEAEQLLKEMGE